VSRSGKAFVALVAIVVFAGCSSHGSSGPAPMTFQQVSDAALGTLASVFYSEGNWLLCEPTKCGVVPEDDFDWGADSLTGALYLRWSFDKDATAITMMKALDANGSQYGTCTSQNCPMWSDVPLWDSIAGAHEHFVTASATSLARAESGFSYVDTATEFALGSCPEIDFQAPVAGGDSLLPGTTGLKTLETDSNYIKAALLLAQITGDPSYITKAAAKYASVRHYFLDPSVPLYTVYVMDDGTSCTQIPRRFYGSVNGNMIWNGVALAAATGQSSYLDDAVATGQAVTQDLSDAAGVYADLQTDDDVVEPLIEGMYALATQASEGFARDWLLTNAQAMAAARASNGVYGRFFDGPAPSGQITEWEANGGFALAFVAGQLEPSADGTSNADAWQSATYVADDMSTLPSTIRFTGRAIAVLGTVGEQCCQLGQASVMIDGVPTFDQTGIHQNESNAFGPVPDAVLFAWRWPSSGSHTLSFGTLPTDPKDGGPFLHIRGYAYVP
jgi:hypothetical protein